MKPEHTRWGETHMAAESGTHRLYNDLAWLWPLWGSVDEYREECELFVRLFCEHATREVRTLLDVGCGGGKNAYHLKKYFDLTGIDISEAMLSHAKTLNPECEFLIGDMRTLDLSREFDAVYLNDAVVYMTTEDDLLKAFQSAHRHLRPGGVMVTLAEVTKETFRQNRTSASSQKADDLEIVFIENNYDPDPDDTTYETTFVYLIRERGNLRIEHDRHIVGLFSLDAWRRLLSDAGFEISEQTCRLGGEEYRIFACRKPD
jgi:SAM-dependent methyltransferase